MTCECPAAGWCDRHQIHKHQRWWELCHGPHYNLWEQGRGPGQTGIDPNLLAISRPHTEAGNKAWAALHSYRQNGQWCMFRAATWYGCWKKTIPNTYGCACKKHWAELEEKHPPPFESERKLWLWGWRMHNRVNERLGKPLMRLKDAVAMWRGGG